MKKLSFILFIATLIFLGLFVFSESAKAQCSNSTIINSSNGVMLILGKGVANVNSNWLGVNDASSVKMSGSGCTLRLWHNERPTMSDETNSIFIGYSSLSSGSSSTLHGSAVADWARVQCNSIVNVYDSTNRGGASYPLPADSSGTNCFNLNSVGWKDRIRSAAVPSGCLLTLYNDMAPYSGCDDTDDGAFRLTLGGGNSNDLNMEDAKAGRLSFGCTARC